MSNLQPGDQVIRIPPHANGNADHPDCELGFVTSNMVKADSAFVTYFNRNMLVLSLQRQPTLADVRSRSASELTPIANLKLHLFADQQVIMSILRVVLQERSSDRIATR